MLNPCFSQQQKKSAETITITTYYPAPYGVYRDLQTQRLAVGDTNRDDVFDSNDVPDSKGSLYVAGSMYINLDRYKMQVQFMNLGEDEYCSCKEGPNRVRPRTQDTCNGDTTLAYFCPPNEEKTCYDVFSADKDICTGELLYFKKPITRRVICQVAAAWKEVKELEEE